jgi:uncharacterized membrane protein
MEKSIKGITEVQRLMKLTYGIVPMVAGADKFTNLLTNWTEYLNPTLAGMLPFSGNTFMMIVGIIEIVAGILVFIKPQKGAYVVSAWLVLIAVNLIASGKYLDVAVRDLVMAIGAFSLAKISGLSIFNEEN